MEIRRKGASDSTHLLDEFSAFLPRLALHFHVPPERRVIEPAGEVVLPPLDLAELPRGEEHALAALLRPLGALFDALDERLREPRLLGLGRALALRVLRALDGLAKEQDDRRGHLGEANAAVHGRAREVLGEQERALLRETLVVHARLDVLLRGPDVRVEVERAERRRFWFGRGGERGGEDGQEVGRERNVCACVFREV